MLSSGMPPIRKAVAALLLSLALLSLAPSDAAASPERSRRPAAALVASSDASLRSHGADDLSPLGLAALIAAGWIPAVVLLARRKRHRSAE
jgi:hypothetical protein